MPASIHTFNRHAGPKQAGIWGYNSVQEGLFLGCPGSFQAGWVGG